MSHLLGLDIGTTSTIGILIDADGGTAATASRPSELVSRHPNWAEENPELWWANVCTIVPELFEISGIPPVEVAGVGVTGMVPTLILLDGDGRALRNSIQQNDARAVEEIGAMKEAVDAGEFFALTGGSINQQLIAPKTALAGAPRTRLPEPRTGRAGFLRLHHGKALRFTDRRNATGRWKRVSWISPEAPSTTGFWPWAGSRPIIFLLFKHRTKLSAQSLPRPPTRRDLPPARRSLPGVPTISLRRSWQVPPMTVTSW